jgi:hypothetical protein
MNTGKLLNLLTTGFMEELSCLGSGKTCLD